MTQTNLWGKPDCSEEDILDAYACILFYLSAHGLQLVTF